MLQEPCLDGTVAVAVCVYSQAGLSMPRDTLGGPREEQAARSLTHQRPYNQEERRKRHSVHLDSENGPCELRNLFQAFPRGSDKVKYKWIVFYLVPSLSSLTINVQSNKTKLKPLKPKHSGPKQLRQGPSNLCCLLYCDIFNSAISYSHDLSVA